MTFNSVKATCRICKCDLVVKIASDYPWPVDELLKSATCNRCFDLRERRDNATERIKNACVWLIQNPKTGTDKLKAIRERLERSTKDFAIVIAEYYGSKTLVWSEQFADNLMDNPGKWYEQLNFYRRAIREQLGLQRNG